MAVASILLSLDIKHAGTSLPQGTITVAVASILLSLDIKHRTELLSRWEWINSGRRVLDSKMLDRNASLCNFTIWIIICM